MVRAEAPQANVDLAPLAPHHTLFTLLRLPPNFRVVVLVHLAKGGFPFLLFGLVV